MKQLLVFSDTHRSFLFSRFLEQALLIKPDMLFFCGDGFGDFSDLAAALSCKSYGVCGNCDAEGPAELTAEVEGHRILLTHGHRYGVGAGTGYLISAAKEKQADIVLFGHTHVPEYSCTEGVWIINPGSVCRPRETATGTYCLLTLDGDKVYPEMKTC